MQKIVMTSVFLAGLFVLQGCDSSKKAEDVEVKKDETATLFDMGGIARKVGAMTSQSDFGYNIAKTLTPKKYEKDLMMGNVEQQAEDALASGVKKAKEIGGKITAGANIMAQKFEQNVKKMPGFNTIESGLKEAKGLGEKLDKKYQEKIAPTLERGAEETAEALGGMAAGSSGTASALARKLTPKKYEPAFDAGKAAAQE